MNNETVCAESNPICVHYQKVIDFLLYDFDKNGKRLADTTKLLLSLASKELQRDWREDLNWPHEKTADQAVAHAKESFLKILSETAVPRHYVSVKNKFKRFFSLICEASPLNGSPLRRR
jgi:5S rRNA maturation endonuclease (ribonuclease M5)